MKEIAIMVFADICFAGGFLAGAALFNSLIGGLFGWFIGALLFGAVMFGLEPKLCTSRILAKRNVKDGK